MAAFWKHRVMAVGRKGEFAVFMFEEFQQLGDQARYQGSGLGFAIVAQAAPLRRLEISFR